MHVHHVHGCAGQFLEENEATLRTLPPPRVAVEYYRGTSLALFGALCGCCGQRGGDAVRTDAFHTTEAGKRRPQCHTLYDVFTNIRDDELQHVGTMHTLSSRGKE